MKRARVADGDVVLPSGATLRIAHGRDLTIFFGPASAPTPSRERVEGEVFELTGLRVWLENWPNDAHLHHDVPWPGIAFAAVILDHDERIAESGDVAALGALLTEIVELGLCQEFGWKKLGIDPVALPSFGGDRPDVPSAFFWRWNTDGEQPDTSLPALPLSWDRHRVLIAADPHSGPFCVPRHPSRLFTGPQALRCGLDRCTDAEAFERLASVLPWGGGPMETIGASGLYFLSAHTRSGSQHSADDPRDLGIVVRETTSPVMQRAREVIAAGKTQALRDPRIALEIVSSHTT